MPVLAPDPLVQACSAQAKARFFSCLMTQKSFEPEASLIGMKSCGQSLLNQGGAFHHPEASCWVAGSLKAATCHYT